MAHRSVDILERAKVFGDLGSALSKASEVIGFTARPRRKGPLPLPFEQLAAKVLSRARSQPVALLFGPEATGLSNEELSHCRRVASLSCGPHFPSLNLAQAVLAAAYTLRLAAAGRKMRPPPLIAPTHEVEGLLGQLAETLFQIGFFKGKGAPSLLRDLRQLILRAAPNTREVRILRGILRQALWRRESRENTYNASSNRPKTLATAGPEKDLESTRR